MLRSLRCICHSAVALILLVQVRSEVSAQLPWLHSSIENKTLKAHGGLGQSSDPQYGSRQGTI